MCCQRELKLATKVLQRMGLEPSSKVAVVGLGATGYSVVRFMQSQGLNVTVFDTRAEPALLKQLNQEFPAVSAELGQLNADELKRFDVLVVSPGISIATPALKEARRAGVSIIGDVELFARLNAKPMISITGSNGKSTVTVLLAQLLKPQGLDVLMAGNIGKPVLDAYAENSEYDVAVLELSSFQLETTKQLGASVACILNISEDHMDRYDSMGDYVLAKQRIFRGAQAMVLPRHDSQLAQFLSQLDSVYSFELDQPNSPTEFGVARISGSRWLLKGESKLMRLADIPLKGLHNVNNTLAALSVVYACEDQGLFTDRKLDTSALFAAIKSFKGLAHRTELIATRNGVDWINDSKATNVGATITALSGIDAPIIWLAGGQTKGADLRELKPVVAKNAKAILLFGEDAPLISDALSGLDNIEHFNTLDQAVEAANKKAVDGDAVLLSPACASFDQYPSFEQRGDHFRTLVMQLDGNLGSGND